MMLTGVTEITRNASSASRGLVMVSSRLTQVLDSTSSTGKKLTKIYEDLGIELKDENGQLRSHYDILGDLAGQWDSLSENQQKYIALTSAGARQQQNFVALMENWNQVAKATATAYNSIGSAQKENEKVMDSIAKKVEILKSEFQQLVIGKGGLQEFAKTILDIGIALLKFANSDIGKAIIGMGIMVTSLALLKKGYTSLTASIINNTKEMVTNYLTEKGLLTAKAEERIATMTLTEAVKLNTAAWIDNAKAMLANPFTWIIASIAGAIAITVKYNQVLKETKERIEEAKKTIGELKQEINDLNYEQQKEAEISKAEENRLTYLKKRLELEEKVLEVKEKAANAREQTMKGDILTTLTGALPALNVARMGIAAFGSDEIINSLSNVSTLGGRIGGGNEQPNAFTQVDETTLAKYEKLNEEIATWNDYTDEGIKLLEQKYNESLTYQNSLEAERDGLGKLRDEYERNGRERKILLGYQEAGIPLTKEQTERLNELSNAQTELNDRDKERLDVLENSVGAYKRSIDDIKTYNEAIEEFGEDSEEADSIIKEFAKNLGISEEQLEANANALGLSIDSYYDYASAVKASDEAIDGFQSSIETLQGAVEEYNESQYLSLDTMQSLLSLQPEYLDMLVEENGQLKLNENAIVDKCNALIEERKQTALQMAYDRLAAIERGENAEAANVQSASIDGNTSSLNAETTALSKNTVEQYANRIARNDKAKGTAASQVLRDLEKELSILDKVGNSYNKISKSAKKAGSAGKSGAKSAKNAQKELNKELEETKKKYEQVISWIKKQYDKKIDSIKNAKDDAVDSIDKEIDALEKEKDSIVDGLKDKKDALEDEKDTILDGIEAEIKGLEDSKKARQDYWDAQIDALKKANQERKDALELQEKLDALERAKNTKVKIYKEGQGFVYDVDQTKVAEAQKALDEYLSEKAYEDELARLEALKDAELDNYEKRIDALNDYKDKRQDALEKEIEALEDYISKIEKDYDEQLDALKEHKEAVEAEYDAEIKMYEDYKQKFEDMVNAYEEEQNRLLAQQLANIDTENDNWMTRLDNLAEFVRKYNELQKQLDTGNTSVSNDASMKSGNGGGGGGSNGSSSYNPKNPSGVSTYNAKGSSYYNAKGGSTSVNNNTNLLKAKTKATVAKMTIALGNHADGIGSIKDDEISVVGENPNKEIVIGSKINNGELMSLGKGTGVVNADSSKTLAGMLNQVGQFGSSGFGSGNGTLNSNINNDSLTINGVTIEGSQINDPQTFVNGLLNLKSEALQRAYKHR